MRVKTTFAMLSVVYQSHSEHVEEVEPFYDLNAEANSCARS